MASRSRCPRSPPRGRPTRRAHTAGACARGARHPHSRLAPPPPLAGSACRSYILAIDLASPFAVTLADLGAPPPASAAYRVFDYFNPGAGGVALDAAHPLTIPVGSAQPSAPAAALPIRYLVAAPVLPGGWVLYGEAGKIVPMAAKRTSRLVVGAGGFSVDVAGAAGAQNEAAGVTFWTLQPGAALPIAVHCPAAASSVLSCTTATRSCACQAQ